MVTNPESTNNKAGGLTLAGLAREVEYIPGQTKAFIEMLAAFVENQEDVTGFRVDNLRLMARSLRMDYEAIDGLLSVFDKFEKPETGKDDREG